EAGKGSGAFTGEDMMRCVEKAKSMAKKNRNYFLPNQFSNRDNVEAHKRTTAEEIWKQTDGKINYFIAAAGTGGTVTGVGEVMKEKNPKIKIVAVEPKNSAVMTGGNPGPHKIQGIGEGFIPEVMRCEICDEIVQVSDAEAIKMCNRLAKEEGIFSGISSGANVVAALKIAKKAPKNSIIVTMAPDSGARYLSARVFSDRFSFC
ncbi:MAG: cysteine synthase family protein, partial [Planctomycetota bacterium]